MGRRIFWGSGLCQDLDGWQTEQRVAEYPTLLEFLGYA